MKLLIGVICLFAGIMLSFVGIIEILDKKVDLPQSSHAIFIGDEFVVEWAKINNAYINNDPNDIPMVLIVREAVKEGKK